jgi:hypothetical protein
MRSRPAERFVGISEPEMFTFVYPVVPTKENVRVGPVGRGEIL